MKNADELFTIQQGQRFGKSFNHNIMILKAVKNLEAGKTIMISYVDRDVFLKVEKINLRIDSEVAG